MNYSFYRICNLKISFLSYLIGLFFYCYSTLNAQSVPSIQFISNSFVSEVLDFSDLEVRDSSNRILKSQNKQNHLYGLFMSSVYQALTSERFLVLSNIRRRFEMFLVPFAERIQRLGDRVFHSFDYLLTENLKRVKKYLVYFKVLSADLMYLDGCVSQTHSFFSFEFFSHINLPLRC